YLFEKNYNPLPIGPEKARGPLVAPSRCSNRCRNGSSLAWSWHTNHCKGFCISTSRYLMTPLCAPMFTLVPSHPTAASLLTFTLLATINSIILFLICNADPAVGETCPI